MPLVKRDTWTRDLDKVGEEEAKEDDEGSEDGSGSSGNGGGNGGGAGGGGAVAAGTAKWSRDRLRHRMAFLTRDVNYNKTCHIL